MFKIDSCELTVQDGQMTAKLVQIADGLDLAQAVDLALDYLQSGASENRVPGLRIVLVSHIVVGMVAELTVQDGQMTAKLVLGSESFDKMFAGNKNAAKLAVEGVVEGAAADGKTTFTLPVAELDKALDYAAHSVKKDGLG